MAEELKDIVNVQEIHIVEVLVSMRNLGGFPNYGCKYCHMVHQLEALCRRVHVIPHRPICIGVPLHSLLALLFFLWRAPFDLNSGLIKKMLPVEY